jgi:hypothetical protein
MARRKANRKKSSKKKIPENLTLKEMEQHIEKRVKKAVRRQETGGENVKDWLEFSMHPQSEDAIRERLLKEIEEESPGKYLCLSYVCKNSKLSEDFIEELIQLTSCKRRYTIGQYHNDTREIIVKQSSRLDWRNISMFQKLSEDFIERHKNDVLWEYIFQSQDLSEEFKKEHKHDYETSLIEDSNRESEDIIEEVNNENI